MPPFAATSSPAGFTSSQSGPAHRQVAQKVSNARPFRWLSDANVDGSFTALTDERACDGGGVELYLSVDVEVTCLRPKRSRVDSREDVEDIVAAS